MKKRLLTILLTLTMILALIPAMGLTADTKTTVYYLIATKDGVYSKVYDGTALTLTPPNTSFTTFNLKAGHEMLHSITNNSITHVNQYETKVYDSSLGKNIGTLDLKDDTGYPIIKDDEEVDVTSKYIIIQVKYISDEPMEEGCTTFTIISRDITLQSESISKEYDGTALTAYSNPPEGGTTITDLTSGQTDKGYVTGETFDYSFTGSQLFVGNSDNIFTVSDSSTAKTTDYNVTKQYGKLTVTNRTTPLTIELCNQEKIYDGTADILTTEYTVKGELAYGDTITVTPTTDKIDAGSYTDAITATYKINHDNGNGTFTDVTDMYANVNITPGTLTVKVPDYLTFTADSAFKVALKKTETETQKAPTVYVQYSTDKKDWKDLTVDTAVDAGASNDKYVIYFRNGASGEEYKTNPTFASALNKYHSFNFTDADGETAPSIAASGNIMTLLDYKNPATITMGEYAFAYLFNRCNTLISAPELPAKTLAQYCYFAMFNGCGSLTAAPELPAKTLVDYCYNKMFQNCYSLTAVPKLEPTTLANSCYFSMFKNCTGLYVTECSENEATWTIPASSATDPVKDMAKKTAAGGATVATPTSGSNYYKVVPAYTLTGASAGLPEEVTTGGVTFTVKDATNADVAATTAAKDRVVTAKAVEVEGYNATLTAVDADGQTVTVAADGTFTMPAKAVTVKATYKEILTLSADAVNVVWDGNALNVDLLDVSAKDSEETPVEGLTYVYTWYTPIDKENALSETPSDIGAYCVQISVSDDVYSGSVWADVNILPAPVDAEHELTSGTMSYKVGSKDGIVLISNAEFGNFANRVTVSKSGSDEEDLTVDVDYTAEDGSIKVTLTKAYCDKLETDSTYVFRIYSTLPNSLLGAPAVYTEFIVNTIANCSVTSTVALKAGKNLTLIVDSKNAGVFDIEKKSNGYTLYDTAEKKYVAFNTTSKKVELSETAFVWSYANGGLYTTVTTKSSGSYWWWWTSSTKTKYYLTYNSELGTSTSAKKVQVEETVEYDEHDPEYHIFDSYHTATCKKCGETLINRVDHDYTYDAENHKCVCGKVDPTFGGVTKVSVKETSSTSHQGWLWWRTKVTTYTYTISTKQENVTVTSVQYSKDDKTYTTVRNQKFTSNSKLSSFYLEITDSNGNTTKWYYDGTTTKKVNAPD